MKKVLATMFLVGCFFCANASFAGETANSTQPTKCNCATNLVKTAANVVVKKCAKDVNVSKLIANAWNNAKKISIAIVLKKVANVLALNLVTKTANAVATTTKNVNVQNVIANVTK